jgi:threonine dehydratase
LQVTGSFHVRGALVAVASAHRSRVRRIVVPSAGNHGVAVAYVAGLLDLDAIAVVPRSTSRTKREKIERYGAELVVAPFDGFSAAQAMAEDIARTREALLVEPLDDVNIALGNGASLGFEIVRSLGRVPDRVLTPFDGGLSIGLAWAMAADATGGAPRTVWGVDGEGPEAATLADELSAPMSEDMLRCAQATLAGIGLVTETEIAAAMAHAYRDLGLVLEGTAAMALAPAVFGLPPPLCGGDLVVVLTGRNVDPDRLDQVLARPHA